MKIEEIIKALYKRYKSLFLGKEEAHPNEEMMACYIEGFLGPQEVEYVKQHLLHCDKCAENFAAQTSIEFNQNMEVPADLMENVKNQVMQEIKVPALEILYRIKGSIIELFNTNGAVLMDQELIPAPLLRSRQIKDFRDEVTILKDFAQMKAEIKIEKKGPSLFNLSVTIKERLNSRVIKDLRVTLLKGDIELESYITDSGKIMFEHLPLDNYAIEISDIKHKLISILLNIKI
ncbi:MAG: hypothetical protein ABIH18_05235 [Candidatus Omnitrophota bacterium]